MGENDQLRVLYVDDEPLNLKLMKDVFTLVLKRPEQVVTAPSGREALEILACESFDALLSDQRMAGMSGTELLARARQRAPGLARLILTGYPHDVEVQEALRSGLAHAVVSKPWRPRELERVIHHVLSQPR